MNACKFSCSCSQIARLFSSSVTSSIFVTSDFDFTEYCSSCHSCQESKSCISFTTCTARARSRSLAFLSYSHHRDRATATGVTAAAAPGSLPPCAIASCLKGCENKWRKLRLDATADQNIFGTTARHLHDVNKQHETRRGTTRTSRGRSRFKKQAFIVLLLSRVPGPPNRGV